MAEKKRGPGRPPTGQELAQVRLDRDTAQAVRVYIERTGLTRSAALRALIRAGLSGRRPAHSPGLSGRAGWGVSDRAASIMARPHASAKPTQ